MREHLISGHVQFAVPEERREDPCEFANAVYQYHHYGGFHAILARAVQQLFTVCIVLVWTATVFCIVDWDGVVRCASDRGCSIVQPHMPNALEALLIAIGFGALIFSINRVLRSWRLMRRVRTLYEHTLGIPDAALHVVAWEEIIARIMALDPAHCPLPQHGAACIAQLIMRDENFLIMLANSELVPMSLFLPTTRALLYILLWKPLCDDGKRLDALRGRDASFLGQLQRRAVGVSVLLCPLLCAWIILYRFVCNIRAQFSVDETLMRSTFSEAMRVQLRRFNELPHAFESRMLRATVLANKYLETFPSPWPTSAAATIALVLGSAVALIVLIGFANEDALGRVHIGQYNLVWWLAALTTVIGCTRRTVVVAGAYSRRESAELLRLLSTCTDSEAGTSDLRRLRKLLRPRWMHMIAEIGECIFAPIRIYRLDVPEVAAFVLEHSFFLSGAGSMCAFASQEEREAHELALSSERLTKKSAHSWSAYSEADAPAFSLDELERVEAEIPV